MLIRMLGKEKIAQSGNYSHPFCDIPKWADTYVGYAYSTGLSNGVSAIEFGSGDSTAATFLTFVLRALGYTDKGGADFTWDSPFDLARKTGILTDNVDINVFLRADVAIVVYNALSATIKGTSTTLASKLISEGVFSEQQYSNIFSNTGSDNVRSELSAVDIFKKCSPSVIYIKVTDVDGNDYASGSGVIIDSSGIAITNYHVLENALAASALTSDGVTHAVLGVIGFDSNNDFAIIKIDGSNFTPMNIGDVSSLLPGENIFTIGNPMGLTNTISDGIVSNPCRSDYSGWIQITAPISHGSSGGALINQYGELVGITTATLTEGQNLNFAIPINLIIDTYNKYVPLRSTPYTSIKDYAAYVAYIESLDIPEAFKNVYNESEPNDIYQQAAFIDNGMSVHGTINDGYCDLFPIRCNTTGRIDVYLFSDSDPVFVKDLMLVIVKQKSGETCASSEYYEFSDGTAARMIESFNVDVPGIYMIEILSYSLYQYYDINTDYTFYYKFTPDCPKLD